MFFSKIVLSHYMPSFNCVILNQNIIQSYERINYQ